MKRLLIASLLSASLAACGGGGGGGTVPAAPAQTPVPTPAPTPTPVPPVNSALSFYLPLHPGNTWTFNNGSYISDTQTTTLSCSCGGNGHTIEVLDLMAGSYVGSLIYAKLPPSAGAGQGNGSGLWTVLVGISQDHGATISLLESASGNTGIGVMEDHPAVGDYWTNAGGTSTITAINGKMKVPNLGTIVNIATDTLTDSSAGLNQTWQYAQGVGFVSLSQSGASITLTSFTVDTLNSFARHRQSAVRPAIATTSDVARITSALFR